MIANVGSTLLSALMEVPAQVDPTQSILSVMRNWMTALGVTVQGGRESRLKKAAGSGGRRFRTLGDSDPQCTGARSQEELKR